MCLNLYHRHISVVVLRPSQSLSVHTYCIILYMSLTQAVIARCLAVMFFDIFVFVHGENFVTGD